MDVLVFEGNSWKIPRDSLSQSNVYMNLPEEGDWEIFHGNENLIRWFQLKVDKRQVSTRLFTGIEGRYELLTDVQDQERRDFLESLSMTEVQELLILADYLDIPRLTIDCDVVLLSKSPELVLSCFRYIHENSEKFEPMTRYLT